MHRSFRKLLDGATGSSEFVIAVNADVRGFSRFSLGVESVEAGLFVRKLYTRLLDEYFEDADFFKPTGDGLLLIYTVTEATLGERTNRLVASSLRLAEDFDRFLDDEPLVNFGVPKRIGVGLSRGAASRLVSGDHTLDYSGRVLNLASRLMDLARPAGVVFDESIGPHLLDDELRSRFTQETVFVRSVAETVPITIYCSSGLTKLPASSREPIDAP